MNDNVNEITRKIQWLNDDIRIKTPKLEDARRTIRELSDLERKLEDAKSTVHRLEEEIRTDEVDMRRDTDDLTRARLQKVA